jgi:hypothetical protein
MFWREEDLVPVGIKPHIVQLKTYYTELFWLPILNNRDKNK